MELTFYPNPILLTKCREVTQDELAAGIVCGYKFMELRHKMLQIMKKNNGCGLAAPQVGLDVRLFVCDAGGVEFICINPQISDLKGRAPDLEGCLSIPGVRGYVMRAQKLTLNGMGFVGTGFNDLVPFEVKIKDPWFARAVQHECDHLDGKLFIDIMAEADKQNAADKLAAMRRDWGFAPAQA